MKNRWEQEEAPEEGKDDGPASEDDGATRSESLRSPPGDREDPFHPHYEPEESPIPEQGRARWTLPLCFFVWSLFQPVTAAYAYVAVSAVFLAFLMMLIVFGKPKLDPSAWTWYEIEIIKMYSIAVEYPPMAASFSGVLRGFRHSGIIWIPWLLWNHFWLLSIFLILMFFVSWPFSMRLDPLLYIGKSIEYGHKHCLKELAALMVVRRKFKATQSMDKDRE